MHRNIARGYTLIEMLVYTAVVALIAVVVVQSFLPLSRLYANLVLSTKLNASGGSALERIVREVRLASDIAPGSSLGTSPGTLVLTTTDSGGAATTYTFAVTNGRITLQEGGGSAYPLTASGVTVDRLVFYSVANATTSETVSIDMKLSASKGSVSRTMELRGSAIVRNAY